MALGDSGRRVGINIKGQGDGNGSFVGIGSASPGRTLDVAGRGRFIDSNATVDINPSNYGPINVTHSAGYANISVNSFQIGALTTATNEGYIQTNDQTRRLNLNHEGWLFESGSSELMRLDANGSVGIGTDSPQADFQVSGSGVFGIIGVNSVNSTVTVAGYDNFGLDFRAHNTWTHWKARVGHGRNFELYNDGISNQNQVLELGKTTKDNAKIYVRSTGAFIEAGMNNSTTIPVVSMGCLPDSDHLGGAFLDVRDVVTRTHRYEFNRDGTFLASGIKIASTLTHDGDTDTLLEFTDNTIKLEAGGGRTHKTRGWWCYYQRRGAT